TPRTIFGDEFLFEPAAQNADWNFLGFGDLAQRPLVIVLQGSVDVSVAIDEVLVDLLHVAQGTPELLANDLQLHRFNKLSGNVARAIGRPDRHPQEIVD